MKYEYLDEHIIKLQQRLDRSVPRLHRTEEFFKIRKQIEWRDEVYKKTMSQFGIITFSLNLQGKREYEALKERRRSRKQFYDNSPRRDLNEDNSIYLI